ncbi:hypothetical protein D3C73_1462650 [compost metagenome]
MELTDNLTDLLHIFAADLDFILNAPEQHRRMVIILADQLGHLRLGIFTGQITFRHPGNKRNLRPDDHSRTVT